MKNIEKWTPSKFYFKNGELIISRNVRELGVGSRLIALRVAQMYNQYIRIYAKGVLVDLGCGKVPLYEAYKEYVTENICVDWENTLHKNDLLDYECDLNKPLPLSDARFDTIILSDVLQNSHCVIFAKWPVLKFLNFIPLEALRKLWLIFLQKMCHICRILGI